LFSKAFSSTGFGPEMNCPKSSAALSERQLFYFLRFYQIFRAVFDFARGGFGFFVFNEDFK